MVEKDGYPAHFLSMSGDENALKLEAAAWEWVTDSVAEREKMWRSVIENKRFDLIEVDADGKGKKFPLRAIQEAELTRWLYH